MKQIALRYNIKLYPKEALMKTAYHFIDKYYIRIDLDNGYYVVEVIEKENYPECSIELDFENELLAQTVRYQVYQQTHTIREFLMARAMSSTITGAVPETEDAMLPDKVDNLESILKDWFEKNEK